MRNSIQSGQQLHNKSAKHLDKGATDKGTTELGAAELGATMLEYCLLALLLIVGIVASLVIIGGETSSIFSEVGTGFDNN